MPNWRKPLLIGVIVGLVFGSLNLAIAWLAPLEDDTPWVILRFYGPMFFIWALVSYRAARRDGQLTSGIATGLIVAFGTFCVFSLFNAIRVNLFLDQLAARSDWQDMMLRFRASGMDSLRSFINADYFKGTPSKLAAAETIGLVMGAIGAVAGMANHPHRPHGVPVPGSIPRD